MEVMVVFWGVLTRRQDKTTPGFLRVLSGFVSIPPPKAGAPQEIALRISPDHNLVDAMTKILIDFGVRVQLHGAPV